MRRRLRPPRRLCVEPHPPLNLSHPYLSHPHVLTVRNQRHAPGIASKRAAIPAAGARSQGLRDLHARSAGTNHDLEQRSRTHQGLSRRRDHRRAFLTLLHAGGPAGRRAHARAPARDHGRPLRGRGLARAQGWQPLPRKRRDRSDPRRCGQVDRLCQGDARRHRTAPGPADARANARAAAAMAENGSHRPAHRRSGPRFQQFAHHRHRQSRNRAAPPRRPERRSGVPVEARARQRHARSATRGHFDAAAARLFPAATARPKTARHQQVHRRRGRGRGSAGLWPVEVDAHQLEAALLNLAVNARDAMPNGGKLTIETSNAFLDHDYCSANPEVTPGQYVMIAVSDNGTGMTKNIADRAFEPFFSTKGAGQGTGLGLSQVYGFIKQSKGHIKIYSEVGEGTSVKIYLPRLLQDIDRREEEQQPAQAVEGPGHETILVVEDDRDVRAYLVELLRDLNYRVLSAHDAVSALGLIENGEIGIDLLLTDVVLPGMNGRQLAEQAKNRRPDLQVLFTTGYSRNAIVHQGRLDPGVAMIQKPITQESLAARIRDLLDARRA